MKRGECIGHIRMEFSIEYVEEKYGKQFKVSDLVDLAMKVAPGDCEAELGEMSKECECRIEMGDIQIKDCSTIILDVIVEQKG